MTSTLDVLVDVLTREIGYRERGENDTKYNRWLGPISGYGSGGYGYPWCASFASWAYAHAGLSAAEAPRTAGCASGVAWYKSRKRWSSTPTRGCQVFYGAGGGTHTEVVVDVDGTYITTIGGNTSGSLGGTYYNGDGVYKKKVRRSESRIYGYGMPIGLEDDVALSSDDIKKIAAAVWSADVIAAPPWKAAEGNKYWSPASYLHWGYRQGADTNSRVASLNAAPAASIDAAAVAAEVLKVLTPEAIASAIPADMAGKVLDELKGRL